MDITNTKLAVFDFDDTLAMYKDIITYLKRKESAM